MIAIGIALILMIPVLAAFFSWISEERDPVMALLRDQQRRGVHGKEAMDENRFRIAMVRIRREASIKVLAGMDSTDAIRIVAERECDSIAILDRDLAKRVLVTVCNLPSYEILSPEADAAEIKRVRAYCREIREKIGENVSPDIAADVRAALRP